MATHKNKVPLWMRIVLAGCGVLLISVLFVPIWRIDLDAPQYPEGLRLLIFAGKLGGDVEIINGLNHYIGMKTLHAEDFIEFTVLPYIIGIFAVLFLGLAAWGKRSMLFVLLGLFVAFGILAMVDFWRWEYNYGHNLDPNAAIIVPGMAYQPPLIGFKQLLNFGAYSMPDVGGWFFVIVGLLIVACAAYEVWSAKKKHGGRLAGILILILAMPALNACTVDPRPLRLGADNCHHCQMTVSDQHFGAELITKKGKIYVFDDSNCAIDFLREKTVPAGEVAEIYLVDYSGNNQLIPVKDAHLFRAEDLRSPMGGNVAAFSSLDSLEKYMQGKAGERVIWDDLAK